MASKSCWGRCRRVNETNTENGCCKFYVLLATNTFLTCTTTKANLFLWMKGIWISMKNLKR